MPVLAFFHQAGRLLWTRYYLGLSCLLLLPFVSACSTLGYYIDAINGHFELMSKQQPIDDLLEQESLDKELREKLTLAKSAREFASQYLSLPDNDSYRDYADIKRPYVVWNVIAAPAYSIQPKQWCFLFAGCINYRGYFNKKDAQDYAAELRQQGYDVYVAGARAYSTLGWFDDPLLNTMLYQSESRLVGIIFHELAHQRLYIDDDSSFNEAFASAVEQEGVKRWLSFRKEKYLAHIKSKNRDREFKQLLINTRSWLKNIYEGKHSEDRKAQLKQAAFDNLKAEYIELKRAWGGYGGYDKWMAQDLNNAHLALVATYHELVPAFQTLLKNNNNDLNAFYVAAEKLGRLPKKARTEALKNLKE